MRKASSAAAAVKTGFELAELDPETWTWAIARWRKEGDPAELVRMLRGRQTWPEIPAQAREFLADLIEGRQRPPAARRGRKARLSQAAIDMIRNLATRGRDAFGRDGSRASQKVVELELAQAFGVSVATIREVLASKPRRRYSAK